jgi:hypothetical protein
MNIEVKGKRKMKIKTIVIILLILLFSATGNSVSALEEGYLGAMLYQYRWSKKVIIKHVAENSPADKAGLQKEDVIVECNHRPVNDVEDFIQMIRATPPGESLSLKILRQRKTEGLLWHYYYTEETVNIKTERRGELEVTGSSSIPKDYYFAVNSPFFQFRSHEADEAMSINLEEQKLRYFLLYEFKLPKGYILNTFDCSEMAAYTEWALENAGFDAYIAVGRAPFDKSGYHAWVLVRARDPRPERSHPFVPKEKWIPLEPTALLNKEDRLRSKIRKFFTTGFDIMGIVGELIPYYNDYLKGYDNLYKSIAEIPPRYAGEFDWWNEVYVRENQSSYFSK